MNDALKEGLFELDLRHLRSDEEASLSLSARKLSLKVTDFTNEFLLMKLRHKL